MKVVLVALCLALGAVQLTESAAAAVGSTCSGSKSCGSGLCCRDTNNRVISQGGLHGGFINIIGHRSGTCSSQKAQKGDVCDGSCQCDTGLACYTPMSGMCCPQSTCVDEAYAKQQRQYWANCFANPNCAIPA